MTVIPSYVRYVGFVTIGLLVGQFLGISNQYTPFIIALNLGLLTTLLLTTYLFPSLMPDFSMLAEEEDTTPSNRQAQRAKERKDAKDEKKKEKSRKG